MRMKYFGLLALVATATVSTQAEPPLSRRPITIQAVEGLQFDPPRAKLEPGQRILVRFLNRDPNDQPHNFLIIKPGSLQEIQQASMQINEQSIARGYVPEHEAILKASKLLTADQSEEFIFTAPNEPGVYPYVCTYPGHAMVMYGALYVGTKYGSIESDENIPDIARQRYRMLNEAKNAVIRPSVKRFFLENAGPAAIAVALENEVNYCWDAGNCRLRYAWTGDFIDVGNNARSNGSRQAKVEGKTFWNGDGDELTYSVQFNKTGIKPDFKGYRLIEGKPEFKYMIGDLEVSEYLTSPSSSQLAHRIKISNAKIPVRFYAKGNVVSSAGERKGDYIIVSPEEAADFSLTYPAK